MMVVMLVAGIGCLAAGILAIGFGIPVKEFSFGNTLILTGAVTACTGLVILGLWVVAGELKIIAQQLGAELPSDLTPQPASATPPRHQAKGGGLFSRDQTAVASADGTESDAHPSAPPPWQDEAAARSARNDTPPSPEQVETAPAAKPRRNLMFSSTSRRERERAEARAAEESANELPPAPTAPTVPEIGEPPSPNFDDAWPKSERLRSAEVLNPRRSGRAPSTFSDATSGAAATDGPPAMQEDQPQVTVLKSGIVDGMAYSLYSDGSIEAQMPEGMMRFASIDELRSHLDHRS